MSHLSDTIARQPEVVRRALGLDLADAVTRLTPTRRLWLVGTGTSQHAAELGAWMFAGAKRGITWISSASFVDRPQAIGDGDGVLVISHTGETAFAQRARRRALGSGAVVVAITAEGVDWREAIPAAPRERSDTYTASYLAALVVLARLSLELGDSTLDARALDGLEASVRAAAAAPAPLDAAPDRLLVLTGAGPAAITAREGALKLREAARLPAEGYEAEYLLHGSAVPLAPGDALLTVDGDDSGLLDGLSRAAAAEGLTVAAVTPDDGAAGLGPVLRQLPLTVRLQVLAAHFAELRTTDPDEVIVGAWGDDALWNAGSPTP